MSTRSTDSPTSSAIIEAIDDAVPVGVAAYGPESIDSMHRLFAPSPPTSTVAPAPQRT